MSTDKPVPERNPVFLGRDDQDAKRRKCPKCGQSDFSGRNIQGTILFTCRSCKTEWGGGNTPYVAAPSTQPLPPINPNDLPVASFRKTNNGQFVEERRPVPLTQSFRKGAPIPPPGEEDV